MKEPDRRIDANAETPKIGRIPLEPIHDGEMGERSQLPRRTKNLQVNVSIKQEERCKRCLHPKGQIHPFWPNSNTVAT